MGSPISSSTYHPRLMSGKNWSRSSSSGFGSTSTNTPSPPFPGGAENLVRRKVKGTKYYQFNGRDSQIKVLIRDGRIVEGQETLPYHGRKPKNHDKSGTSTEKKV